MNIQAVLPLVSYAPPVGRPDPDAESIRCRAGVEYRDIGVRKILNRSVNSRLPFGWTLNPYRGCEFACTYCYARYTHAFFDLTDWQDFERKIFVKKGAATALRRQLRRSNFRGQSIAIGTATDPYQPAEQHFGVTRSVLEVFREVEGLEISITTKSPLIARDLDLLVELDAKHVIQVNMTITTADSVLARRIERHAPSPLARLRTVEKLTRQGIETNVFCMPLMPGINDGDASLRPLMEAARDAGAADIVASPLFLRQAARARFFPWLGEEFPELMGRYRRLFSWRDYLTRSQSDLLKAPFRRLRLAYGFPQGSAGRG